VGRVPIRNDGGWRLRLATVSFVILPSSSVCSLTRVRRRLVPQLTTQRSCDVSPTSREAVLHHKLVLACQITFRCDQSPPPQIGGPISSRMSDFGVPNPTSHVHTDMYLASVTGHLTRSPPCTISRGSASRLTINLVPRLSGMRLNSSGGTAAMHWSFDGRPGGLTEGMAPIVLRPLLLLGRQRNANVRAAATAMGLIKRQSGDDDRRRIYLSSKR
jgi:hypothetical protein